MKVMSNLIATVSLALFFTAVAWTGNNNGIVWKYLSSVNGDLPTPNSGKQQTSATVFDIDKDGVNDFVITERTATPTVVWYRRVNGGWNRYVVESELLKPEACATFGDVDSDGLLGDGRGNFAKYVPFTGFDNHESKMADLDGNGTLDILGKPYNHDTPRLDIWLNMGSASAIKQYRRSTRAG